MQDLPILEIFVALTMAASLPAFAMAIWHGWKFEQHKSQAEASTDAKEEEA